MSIQKISTDIWKFLKENWITSILSALIFGNTFWSEMQSLDFRFMVRGEIPADSRIVLLDIDDEAKNLLGPPPWKLTELEKLLRPVLASRPAAIGLDLRFYGYTPDYEADLQQFIAAMAQDSIPIVLAVEFTKDGRLLKPKLPYLPPHIRFGSVTLIDPYYPESDDVVRRTRLLSGYDGDQPVYSFSLQLLAAAKRIAPEQCLAELAAAGLTGAETDYHLINYCNNYRHSYQEHLPPGERFVDTFTSFRAGELLEQGQSHPAVAGLQAQIDKTIQDSTIVLVGATYDDSTSADWFRTPLSWKETISGVVVHANILNWLLRRSFISEPSSLLTFFMTLGLIMLSWLVIHFMEFKKAVLILVFVFLVYGLVTFLLFASWEIWLPLIWPLRMAIYFILLLFLLGSLDESVLYSWKKKLLWLMPFASSFSGRRRRK